MLPWESALELLPLASNLTELSIDSSPRHGVSIDDESDSDLCVLMTQDKIDFIEQHLKNLVELRLWCPLSDNISLAALSKLTLLRTDPSSIPKAARVTNQHIVFPTSLRHLDICYEYPINPETLIPSITPLTNLTVLVWSASTFGFEEFEDFMKALPLQLTRLELASCFRKTRATDYKSHTALINLPKLVELDVSDDILSKRGFFFHFAQAPRLRTLRFHGEKQAAEELLSSLATFPHCKSMLRSLSLSTARGRGVFITGDSLTDLIFPIDLTHFPNVKTLELNKIISGTDLVSVSATCNLVSSLEIAGIALTEKELQLLMNRLPFLTHFVMYDAEGFDGYSWCKHPRMERLDISANSFLEEGAGQDAPEGSEDALKLSGVAIPRLKELSVWTRNPTAKDHRARVVSGFEYLTKVDARPCKSFVLQDCPVLTYACVDFTAADCELVIKNTPLLNELDLSFDTEAAVNGFKLDAELPALLTANCSYSRDNLTLTTEMVNLVSCSPILTELNVHGENAVVDVTQLWPICSSLKTINIGDESHSRPES
eukprot:TRINITY_DN2332_c0_g1_i3.p1 TRINITY_DN2332_c0_g1~~TRINITY_DN2332_c0_g1_i3.p1  ORF type:complete len:545 (+),score=66.18 TRINITY_DN2332_c0_g1_i3:1079-2713(+)